MPRRRRKPELFLSHASKDRRFTDALARCLNAYGLRTWYAEHHIGPASKWHDEIGNALMRCTHFALVLSPSAMRSMWVERELKYALQQRRYDGRILPIVYRPCQIERLSWTLMSLQLIYFKDDMERLVEEVVRACRS